MKNIRILFFLTFTVAIYNCSLIEEPPFLANENVYSSGSNAKSAALGMYSGLADYDYFGNDYILLVNLHSGFFVTRKGGNDNKNTANSTIASLNAIPNNLELENSWKGIYVAIGRNNDAIASANPFENPVSSEELLINDAIGQAYFLRAFNYFNLVRLWGEVPLRLRPTNIATIHLAKSSISEVFSQIIKDAKSAKKYMNGTIGEGTAKPYAVNMLLAKVYMTLATAPTINQPESLNYWQLAYDEAKLVYNNYKLVPDYATLFNDSTGDNTEESIFELQSSVGASLDHVRAFTPSNFSRTNTFGWLKINPEIYDIHKATYPNDPRIINTYSIEYLNAQNGNRLTFYPLRARNNFNNGFPWLSKLGTKDPTIENSLTAKNFKIYRYADLLLMLAEISNELQNGEQLGYVREVLNRVNLQPHTGYFGGKESFRNAVMLEYQFELVGEGEDAFNNRRRGYDFFLNEVIIPHNTASTFNSNVDVTLQVNQANVMYLPISQSEINNNNLISD